MLRCLVWYLVDRGRLVQVMLEPDEEVSSIRIRRESFRNLSDIHIFSGQRDVTVSCVDTGSNHAESVLKRKCTINIHESWSRSTRKPSVTELEFIARVEGVMILLDAKSMMIDFGRDVGQCVPCASSSSVKGDEQHVLCLQERVDSGEIRTEEWKRKCDTADNGTKVVGAEVLREHLKVLKCGDAKDVVSWCYAQWCDGLSNAARSWDDCGELFRGSRETYSISLESVNSSA